MSIVNKYTHTHTYVIHLHSVCVRALVCVHKIIIIHHTTARITRDNLGVDTRTGVADYY